MLWTSIRFVLLVVFFLPTCNGSKERAKSDEGHDEAEPHPKVYICQEDPAQVLEVPIGGGAAETRLIFNRRQGACKKTPSCAIPQPSEEQSAFVIVDPKPGVSADLLPPSDYLSICSDALGDGQVFTRSRALACSETDASEVNAVDWNKFVLLFKRVQGFGCTAKNWPLINLILRDKMRKVTGVYFYFWQEGGCERIITYNHWLLIPKELAGDDFLFFIEEENC